MATPNDPFNAFVAGPENAAMRDVAGPLSGLTLAVKDIYAVRGQRTGGGNPDFHAESPVAAATAPAVKRLLDSGARFAGRTQCDELVFSLMGQNVHFPHPVNPAAPGRVTGGSSSGSAAAVAGGLVDIATASDTGGSVRAPAAFCGLIGLRTTHGLISLEGTMPLAPSLDTFGWFARDAEVYERVAQVMLPERESPRWRPLRLAALDALLLGTAEAAEYARMVGIVSAVLGAPRAAPALSQSPGDLYWTFRKLQAFEAWREHGAFITRHGARMGRGVRDRFEFGRDLPADTEAVETPKRDAFRAELAALLGDDGVLVMPTVPGAAPLASSTFDQQQELREKALRLLCLSGLSGFPQITVPLGEVDGAPFGISLLGPAGSDLALVRTARTIMEKK
ncbi:MAG: amidase [Rhizobiaceae bacterium]|nr:amidase [Rhizobiaceae bacterium]